MRPSVSVRELSKWYGLARPRPAGASILDAFGSALSAPVRRMRGEARAGRGRLWALRGVSFEVEPGEVVGVVGRNGAGKSTLLKILSRITRPSAGEVDVYGRVGSLLQVGTGFHPDLTGRENVYLNGTILGMHYAEIRRKFDEIVAFAEVEQFLDMPVKQYSSGMHVRLAFSVAAHVEPDILLLDEVTAVGDAAFQRKCFAKMREISRKGHTVFFVSHNLGTVGDLCRRVLFIESGRLVEDGPAQAVLARYAEHMAPPAA
ncbi:MAG TPA: ABC transporter ATP-binding protein [Pyrinomonadaceae bacterium]|nr:ABC transporter ATP-binding protein [Pyrinomonadaceae bacterium]